jgi:hypothetical protein
MSIGVVGVSPEGTDLDLHLGIVDDNNNKQLAKNCLTVFSSSTCIAVPFEKGVEIEAGKWYTISALVMSLVRRNNCFISQF